jgi:poly(glycerol-phosphate) alpha-glucosyltransferase
LHTYGVIGPKKLGFSANIFKKFAQLKPDIVHTHGIWMYFSYVNKKYHSLTKTPYIITPRGMLDPWQLRQSFWKDFTKKVVLMLYERKHLKEANCIQALCKSEYESIRKFGLKNPVAIIPNGTDLPKFYSREDGYDQPCRWKNDDKRKTLLFLSRIHVKKGLNNLLEAWALTHPDKHNWQLVIAGETKDRAYMQSLHETARKFNILDTVQFIGGNFGQNKMTCFIDADAFILPSFSEGLPMAVLEAMSYKLPVVITPYCNLPEAFESGAAIEVDTDARSITAGINKLIASSDQELSVMGNNGHQLVKERFTWQKVAEATTQMYEWIKGRREKPNFVYLE